MGRWRCLVLHLCPCTACPIGPRRPRQHSYESHRPCLHLSTHLKVLVAVIPASRPLPLLFPQPRLPVLLIFSPPVSAWKKTLYKASNPFPIFITGPNAGPGLCMTSKYPMPWPHRLTFLFPRIGLGHGEFISSESLLWLFLLRGVPSLPSYRCPRRNSFLSFQPNPGAPMQWKCASSALARG